LNEWTQAAGIIGSRICPRSISKSEPISDWAREEEGEVNALDSERAVGFAGLKSEVSTKSLGLKGLRLLKEKVRERGEVDCF
jgi:hypothetical protein